MTKNSHDAGGEPEFQVDELLGRWEVAKLERFVKVKHGCAFSGDKITTEETPNALVTPGNFNLGGGFKSAKFKYFAGDFPAAYTLKEGDIVVTMTDLSKDGDTLGYGAKIPNRRNGSYLHNQRIGLVCFLSDDVDRNFLYWVLRTPEYQGFVLGAATGTSVRHTSPSTIQQYEFSLPSAVRSPQSASKKQSLSCSAVSTKKLTCCNARAIPLTPWQKHCFGTGSWKAKDRGGLKSH